MTKYISLLAILVSVCTVHSSFARGKGGPAPELEAAVGQWRGTVVFSSGVEVPFRFVISRNGGATPLFYFLNASEKFEGGLLSLRGDSIRVAIDQFDNEFIVKLSGDSLNGYFRKQDQSGLSIPVHAKRGETFRFPESGEPSLARLQGNYELVLHSRNGNDEKAVAVFEQNGNRLTGSVLRVTGDTRYLDGIVSGKRFYLSVFFGSGATLYEGELGEDGKLAGVIIGARGRQEFTASRNDAAALPDLYSLTTLKNESAPFNFSFPNQQGKTITLSDPRYRAKALIIAIGGTWCPNCVDEASFLAPWYKKNRSRGVEIISLQFERQTDSAYVNKVFNRFRQRFGIEYELVVAGLADKQKVLEALPALNNFLAFPTTIFVDKQGRVSKIHTGYTGPATGHFYEDFVKEFNEEVNHLVN